MTETPQKKRPETYQERIGKMTNRQLRAEARRLQNAHASQRPRINEIFATVLISVLDRHIRETGKR